MSYSYTPDIVSRNFPELFRAEFPRLLKFVSDYYKYLETTNINDIQRMFDLDTVKVKKFVFNTNPGAPGEVEQVLEARKQVTKEFDAIIEHYLAQYATGIPALFTKDTDGISLFPAFTVDAKTMGTGTLGTSIGVLENPKVKTGRERIVKFLRNAAAIYMTKGTEEGLTFLFRFLYNELATVEYPKEQVLRSSNSTWKRSTRLTIDTQQSGVIPRVGDSITWAMNLPTGDTTPTFMVVITRVIPIQIQNIFVIEFAYDPRIILDGDTLQGGSLLLHKNADLSDSSEILLRKTLSGFNIIVPGAYWTIGRTFSVKSGIPGGVNTVCIVTSVDTAPDGRPGGMTGLSIVDIGSGYVGGRRYDDHDDYTVDEISINISPLDNVWANGDFPIVSESPNGLGGVHITLSISEKTYLGIDESMLVSGSIDGAGYTNYEPPATYTDETPVAQEPYVWDNLGGVDSNQHPETQPVRKYNDWIASFSVITPIYSWMSVDAGKYADATGMLSDISSILQDNFFYQEFSYLVESSIPFREALETIKFNHPAGLKYFYKRSTVNALDFHIDEYTAIDLGNIYVFDEASTEEFYFFNIIARLFDTVGTDDLYYRFNIDKKLYDSYDASKISIDKVKLESYYIDGYVNDYYIKYLNITSTNF